MKIPGVHLVFGTLAIEPVNRRARFFVNRVRQRNSNTTENEDAYRNLFATVGASVALTAADKVDFAKEIQPILQQNCVKCHGPEKQKGKMRLDSREAALKGGKDGPALVVGDSAKSEMVRRLSLPKSDDDFMPAEADPLSKEQIASDQELD